VQAAAVVVQLLVVRQEMVVLQEKQQAQETTVSITVQAAAVPMAIQMSAVQARQASFT
jgi:hypothetical protein